MGSPRSGNHRIRLLRTSSNRLDMANVFQREHHSSPTELVRLARPIVFSIDLHIFPHSCTTVTISALYTKGITAKHRSRLPREVRHLYPGALIHFLSP